MNAQTVGPEPKSGKLRFSGIRPYGREPVSFSTCVDCGTEFPHMPTHAGEDAPRCNGVFIELCPWCRPDSAPWKHGRGR
jgi:hypothetical protein